MVSNRKKYTDQMREDTAKMLIESGKSASSFAEETGIDVNTVCRWVREYRKRHNLPSYAESKGIKPKSPISERELIQKNKELERELKKKEKLLAEEKRETKRYAERELIDKIREIFEENKKVYGYRRMWRAILEEGIDISEYRVRKIMKENGLYPVTVIKFKSAKKGKSTGQYFDNVVKQEFNPTSFNQIWAGDITYIKTCLGWVYLAVVIDLYNREIIGYSISKNIDSELVKRALSNALVKTNGDKKGIIFHSDRGIQYSSKSFQKMLSEYGFIGSMSRPGCPYDNACAESFFSTAKKECIYRKEYVTIDEVKADMFMYIELFYNRKRMHKTLGYKSPISYRMKDVA